MKAWALNKISRLWSWYLRRPTWQKFILWIVLVLAVVLFLVAVVGAFIPSPRKPSRTESDQAHKELVDGMYTGLQTAEEQHRIAVAERKQKLTIQLNQMDKIDEKTIRRREQIDKATTFKELDALQQELDL